MTVRELIVHLQIGDPEALVVVFDHFGRPIHLSETDFDFYHYDKKYRSPQGLLGPWLRVTAVDIGPDPE